MVTESPTLLSVFALAPQQEQCPLDADSRLAPILPSSLSGPEGDLSSLFRRESLEPPLPADLPATTAQFGHDAGNVGLSGRKEYRLGVLHAEAQRAGR
jgi:hypothetical protein